MNRDQIIGERTDAILASDPMLASWEDTRGRVRRALDGLGHVLWVLTIGDVL